jgi:hypothetical protein
MATVYTIELHRGVLANRPASGGNAEPYFATDTNQLFIWNETSSTWVQVTGGGGGTTVTSFGTGTYITLASDTFDRANENPVSGNGKWSVDTLHSIAANEIVGNELEPSAAEGWCGYTGIVWPTNQWAQVQIDALNYITNQEAAVLLVMSRGVNADNGICFEVDGALGATCGISIFTLKDDVPTFYLGSESADATIALYAGDTIRMELYGGTVSAWTIHNGVATQILAPTPAVQPTLDLAVPSEAGIVAINLFWNTQASDVQVSNFQGGLIVSQSNVPTGITAAQAAALAIALG